jgi:pyruvate/2-oxoglutarate dehydrogenase complex dihydrolipoamide dehydrogenase (E3) component
MAATQPNSLPINPPDHHNLALVKNVRPATWDNPRPAGRYNLVVIGAGTAGLVAAAGAAGLGAKVALVERHLMGGDCLNYGCVPSKALIRAARAVADVGTAHAMGIEVPQSPRIDFARIMARMRQVRAQLSENDSAMRFAGLGVDVFFGEARFADRDRVEVDGRSLRFKRAAITTGARAAALPIAGLIEAGYLTNESVFSLTELPRRLAVIGGGPIGCELAQAFRRFGAEVTILELMPQILLHEDRDAAERVALAMAGDGVQIITECKITGIEKNAAGKLLRYTRGSTIAELMVDEILLGVGRAPNVEGLGLDLADVEYDASGVKVNDRLQTSNTRIYAAGDVCSPYKFTHTADALARIVIRNALFHGRAHTSALTIPWCTFTDPEVAHVGLNEFEAATRGVPVRTLTQELAGVDRAVIDGETAGFAKVHVRSGSDRIVGATIVARHASEMISELTVAMNAKMALGALANVIHPYPTQAEAIRKIGDAYNRTRLTPFVRQMFEKWFAWTR